MHARARGWARACTDKVYMLLCGCSPVPALARTHAPFPHARACCGICAARRGETPLAPPQSRAGPKRRPDYILKTSPHRPNSTFSCAAHAHRLRPSPVRRPPRPEPMRTKKNTKRRQHARMPRKDTKTALCANQPLLHQRRRRVRPLRLKYNYTRMFKVPGAYVVQGAHMRT